MGGISNALLPSVILTGIYSVEKEATFSSLLNDPRSEKYQELCITVTGKGE